MKKICFSLLLLLTSFEGGLAGNATWSATAPNGNWFESTNWSPGMVPNGVNDVATFGSSTTTSLTINTNADLQGIIFSPGAAAYSLTIENGGLDFRGALDGFGIENNSSQTQTITVRGDAGGGISRGFLELDTAVGNAGSNIH